MRRYSIESISNQKIRNAHFIVNNAETSGAAVYYLANELKLLDIVPVYEPLSNEHDGDEQPNDE